MTTDELAEIFEKARYQQLRKDPWEDLRESERETRIATARAALESSGAAERLEALASRAAATDGLTALLKARDAEIGRRVAEHDAEVTALETRVLELEAALAAASDRAVRAEAALDALADVVDGVRRAVSAEVVGRAVAAAAEPEVDWDDAFADDAAPEPVAPERPTVAQPFPGQPTADRAPVESAAPAPAPVETPEDAATAALAAHAVVPDERPDADVLAHTARKPLFTKGRLKARVAG